MTTDEESLPQSTLPADTKITLQGFTQGDETDHFARELSCALLDCGCLFDLGRLDGVTVGFDYDDALRSVELGFESTRAREYTRTDKLVGVAKSMAVLREGKVMAHVVFNAPFITALGDPEHEHHLQAVHIIAHELGHVAELKWRDEAMPGVLLKPYTVPYPDSMLLEVAITVWEEYSACRLTALLSDRQVQLTTYAATYAEHAQAALENAYARMLEFRSHGDITRLLVESGEPLLQPLKLAGYMLGHYDGLEAEESLDSLCPEHLGTPYEALLPELHRCLRVIWDTRLEWKDISIFAPITELVKRSYDAAGIHILERDGSSYVDVPYTAATFPGGELALWLHRLGSGSC